MNLRPVMLGLALAAEACHFQPDQPPKNLCDQNLERAQIGQAMVQAQQAAAESSMAFERLRMLFVDKMNKLVGPVYGPGLGNSAFQTAFSHCAGANSSFSTCLTARGSQPPQYQISTCGKIEPINPPDPTATCVNDLQLCMSLEYAGIQSPSNSGESSTSNSF